MGGNNRPSSDNHKVNSRTHPPCNLIHAKGPGVLTTTFPKANLQLFKDVWYHNLAKIFRTLLHFTFIMH